MAGGFEHGAIKTLKHNRGILKRSKARYSKIKELYVGTGYQSGPKNKLPKLSAQEIAKGRLRAKSYYQKRNRIINILIVLFAIAAISVVGFAIWVLLV